MLRTKKNKVFCIGLNKTGTTTVEKVLKEFDYKMGDQARGELLVEKWYQRDFKSIVDFCKSAEAFQDIPFSLPYTYIFLDHYFKNAKFILTERDDPNQWYRSITKFHSKLWADGIYPPTVDELKKAEYRYKGYAYDINQFMFNTNQNDPYNEDVLIKYYLNHNYAVKEYFRSQPGKLIVLNVSNDDDYMRLASFLGKSPLRNSFPWENKTK
tara:strand:+ start:81670 stop:82302 length:633 start_codon:yes stop_codon:yes gene_type:complete